MYNERVGYKKKMLEHYGRWGVKQQTKLGDLLSIEVEMKKTLLK